MPIPELVDYVRTETQQGVAAEDIRVALLEAGWQEFDIENALHDVAAGLHPATPGASIHEDLAQVRGMVAHLAGRVKTMEVRLASIGALPAQGQLPSEFIGPERELESQPHHHVFGRVVSAFIAAAIAAWSGSYAVKLVERNALAPVDHIFIGAVLGVLFVISGIVLMRRGSGWVASLSAALGIGFWATDTFISWRIYHLIEWSVAAALAVLFVVIAAVMGVWIRRLSR